jgi:23S rRNA (pseudouridine1915-N3)-methyltransferase
MAFKVRLVAVSNRQPEWVRSGFDEYAKRLRGGIRLELREIGLAKRSGAASAAQAKAQEGQRVLAALPQAAHVVSLNEQGKQWTTAELATKLEGWSALGTPICLLIGGPDGLAKDCLERANEHWALSRLTLPHGLARIIVAEAIYRGWSLVQGHPYHRA